MVQNFIFWTRKWNQNFWFVWNENRNQTTPKSNRNFGYNSAGFLVLCTPLFSLLIYSFKIQTFSLLPYSDCETHSALFSYPSFSSSFYFLTSSMLERDRDQRIRRIVCELWTVKNAALTFKKAKIHIEQKMHFSQYWLKLARTAKTSWNWEKSNLRWNREYYHSNLHIGTRNFDCSSLNGTKIITQI